jgi:glycosyltransferase involved in cell wall biosynthesis
LLGARGDYFGQPLVPAALLLNRTPVVFDCVLSMWETFVEDRAYAAQDSMTARAYRLGDAIAMRLAQLVVTDTHAHVDYFQRLFGGPAAHYRTLHIGTDDRVFHPRQSAATVGEALHVVFWGGFIPLQGVDYILRAAARFRASDGVRFSLFGSGQTFAQAVALKQQLGLVHVRLTEQWIAYEKLPELIADADVCLGVFGPNKGQRVIPNKAYEAIAMAKPLVSGDSAALRELFTPEHDCLAVNIESPDSLADALCRLRDDVGLRQRLRDNGYALYQRACKPVVVAGKLLELVAGLA